MIDLKVYIVREANDEKVYSDIMRLVSSFQLSGFWNCLTCDSTILTVWPLYCQEKNKAYCLMHWVRQDFDRIFHTGEDKHRHWCNPSQFYDEPMCWESGVKCQIRCHTVGRMRFKSQVQWEINFGIRTCKLKLKVKSRNYGAVLIWWYWLYTVAVFLRKNILRQQKICKLFLIK